MRIAVLILAAMPLAAQSQADDLKRDLRDLRGATMANMQQVSADIARLAEKTHGPKPATLQQFSNELVRTLARHAVPPVEIVRIANDIQAVMQSAGASTRGFWDTVQDFEARLVQSGVPATRARSAASLLETVGKEVRGPEDFPVK